MIYNSTIENILTTQGEVIFKIQGKSMLPMLRPNCDLVVIKRLNGRTVNIGDVCLNKTVKGLTLHRVVGTLENGTYIMLGDNSSNKEENVSHSVIIGILDGFYKNNIYYSKDNAKYICYIHTLSSDHTRIYRKRLYDIMKRILEILGIPLPSSVKTILSNFAQCKYEWS